MEFCPQLNEMEAPLQNGATENTEFLLPQHAGWGLSSQEGQDVSISQPDPATWCSGQVLGKCRWELGTPFLCLAPACGMEAPPWAPCTENSGPQWPWHLGQGFQARGGRLRRPTPDPQCSQEATLRGKHTVLSSPTQTLGSWMPRTRRCGEGRGLTG